MDYLPVEKCLQAVLERHAPLSRSQAKRVNRLCIAVMLAGEVQLTKIARFVKSQSSQDSRVKWISRMLQAPFISQMHLYQPLLKSALRGVKASRWHLVIDRTTLWDGKTDLTTISLNYHKRAIPLVWCRVPFGGAPDRTYIELIQRCFPLIPKHINIIFHGDSEFGGVGIIRALRGKGWDFMLAQKRNVCFRPRHSQVSQMMGQLPVTPSRSCGVANIELFAKAWLGSINIFAFYQPHYTQCGTRKRDICYLTTSLPLNSSLRRLGRRRWGTEPFYKDYKSSGWQLPCSQLHHSQRQEGLLVILAVLYLWTVCLGRWLCKSGRRHLVDSKPRRHLSLFRLGWDWLIHQLRCQLPTPTLLTLYS